MANLVVPFEANLGQIQYLHMHTVGANLEKISLYYTIYELSLALILLRTSFGLTIILLRAKIVAML